MRSAAVTLSDMEIFVFPELMMALLLALAFDPTSSTFASRMPFRDSRTTIR